MNSGQASFNNQELVDEQVTPEYDPELDEFWKRWLASDSEPENLILGLESELLAERCLKFSTNPAASTSQNTTML
jgi:hypothetical protein